MRSSDLKGCVRFSVLFISNNTPWRSSIVEYERMTRPLMISKYVWSEATQTVRTQGLRIPCMFNSRKGHTARVAAMCSCA